MKKQYKIEGETFHQDIVEDSLDHKIKEVDQKRYGVEVEKTIVEV